MSADRLPSPQEFARALPGGRVRRDGCIGFQDPFDPKPGKRPCTLWLGDNLPDGWTTADARRKIDGLTLKDYVRKAVGLEAFRSRRDRGSDTNGHRATGGVDGDRDARNRHNLAFTLFRDIDMSPRKQWLTYNLFGAGELSCVFGAPGSGKSTLVGDLGGHVAAGMDWFKRRTQKGGVLYVAAERASLVKRRMAAFKKNYSIDDVPLAVISGQPDLRTSGTDAEQIIGHAKRLEDEFGVAVTLIILETISRLLAGGDENSPKDMGALVRLLGTMQEATNAHIMTVHHTPIDGSHRLRGHGSLLGACDTTARVEKRGPVGTVTTDKVNDGPEGECVGFSLKSIELHCDGETGIMTTAPVVVPAALPSHDKCGPRLTRNQQTMFSILHGAGTAGLTTEEWNEKAREVGLGTSRKADLYDWRENLKSKGLVRKWNQKWLADK